MGQIKDLLDKYYSAKIKRSSAIVETIPLNASGKTLGYITAKVSGQSGVKVYIGPNDIFYPGDIVTVEQVGGDSSANYTVKSMHFGSRPSSGYYEFPQAGSINGQGFGQGDLIFGDPSKANWYFNSTSGIMFLRSGSIDNGFISASGIIELGNSTSTHLNLSASGVFFKDASAVNIAGMNGSAFFIGASSGGGQYLAYTNGSLIVNGNVTITGSLPTGINTIASASVPTASNIGDLWFDSDDNNHLYRAAMVGADEIKAGEWEDYNNSACSAYGIITPCGLLITPPSPSGAGLYLGSTYLGYYNGAWKSYLDSSGHFYLTDGTNNILLDSTTPKITVGSATGILTGNGVYMGLDSGSYKFRVGNPAGNYMLYDGNTITYRGNGAGIIGLTGSNIEANSITASNIAANVITTAQLAANAISASNIAACAVTATKISVTNLAALNADMGAITAGCIVVGTTNKLWLNDTNDGALNIGGATKASAPFRVTSTGSLTATAASITGNIDANSGTIGALTVDDTLTVGTGGQVKSTTYVQGISGWSIFNDGSAEFNNIDVRGTLKASILHYGEILATNGTVWITPAAGKLSASLVSVDAPTGFVANIEIPDGLTATQALGLWSASDIVRMKDGLVGDLWGKISSASNKTTYIGVTLVKQSPGAGTNYTFNAGTAIINYKQANSGYIRLTADAGASPNLIPYISIATHAGSPWNAQTERVRLGEISGLTSPVDGSAIAASTYGLWTDSGYFSGSIDANAGHIGTLDIDGVLSLAATGGIYQGTGTFASPSTGLKIWNDGGIGRIAGYNTSASQWGANTDGKLYAGGNSVTLDASGIVFTGDPSLTGKLRFADIPNGFLTGYRTPLVPSGYADVMRVLCWANTDEESEITIRASRGGTWSAPSAIAGIKLLSDSTSNMLYITGDISHNNSAPGYIFVPMPFGGSHANYAGSAMDVGTSSINIANFGVPATAKAISVRLTSKWISASTGGYALLRPQGLAYGAPIIVRAQRDGTYLDSSGIVPCNTSGSIDLVIAGSKSSGTTVEVWGYYI